jgi:hypothetical protein
MDSKEAPDILRLGNLGKQLEEEPNVYKVGRNIV